MNTPQVPRRPVQTGIFCTTLAALLFVAADGRAQAPHHAPRSNTPPTTITVTDDDCDDACVDVVQLHGTLLRDTAGLAIIIDQEGGPPARVSLVREVTPASGSPAPAAAAAGVPPGTPRKRVAAASQSAQRERADVVIDEVRHNDDAVAARALVGDASVEVIFEPIPDEGLLQQGRSTGVRMHSPFKVRASLDKATPLLYHATVAQDESVSVQLPYVPGTYRIVVRDRARNELRGHVTLIK